MELNNITNTGTWGQQVTRLNDNFNKVALWIDTLQEMYESLSQSAIEVVDTLPSTGKANKIYRLVGTTSYSDYMYNTDDLNTPILMATYNNAIENEPTPGSNNLVKSGGIASNIVFDISAYHATGSTLATYADLTSALGTNGANVPSEVRKGGMSIKFVQTYDNKYVQYRLMADSFNTAVANWQGVDDEPTAGSNNLVKSGGVANKLAELGDKVGNEYSPVLEYIEGKYISTNGKVYNSSTSKYSKPFILKSGAIISISSLIANNIATISKVVVEDETYEVLAYSSESEIVHGIVNYKNDTNASILVAVTGSKDDLSVTIKSDAVFLKKEEIVNNIVSNETNKALSANMGRVLNEHINEIDITILIKDILLDIYSYIDLNGNLQGGGQSWVATDAIDVKEGDKIDYSLKTSNGVTYIACYNNNTFIAEYSKMGESSSYTEEKGTFIVPPGINKIRLCSYKTNFTPSVTLYNNTKEEITTLIYNSKELLQLAEHSTQLTNIAYKEDFVICDILNKPFSFNGKKALFCGDSITKGFTDGGHVSYDKNYVKLFCQSVGMTDTNVAVGGAGYTYTRGGADTDAGGAIIGQLESRNLSDYDYIFIAAGSNDHGVGKTIEEFTEAVRECYNYIKSQNYDGEVIIITPINKTRIDATSILTLDYYRDAITKIACEFGFNVIDGSKMPFPKVSGYYEHIVFGDNVHPNEHGYSLYANYLKGILL